MYKINIFVIIFKFLYIVSNRSVCSKNNTLFKQAHILNVQNIIDFIWKNMTSKHYGTISIIYYYIKKYNKYNIVYVIYNNKFY